MKETSMRGTRLGALSYERDETAVPAERHMVRFDCPAGHTSLIPFSIEAEEIPYEWTCKCGETAIQLDVEKPEVAPERYVRTHWDMLLERRSIADLEELLQERLALLHEQRSELAKSA
ncbi:MAG: RNA polymerase-binding protein RbpA [Candidatus Nanopelagicales bacterium]|jgi:RNA polymerase-binding protein|nr:RNA polymerase-binding protein RbpA [Candidatus Nanopelagicales bacterium]